MNSPTQTKHSVGITIRALRKSFGGEEVLKGIDLEIHQREIFIIMGPSGSGKSVLLKHIIGLETPDSGEILIEGEPIQSSGVMDKYRMAIVFQSGALLNSLTVGENVGLYLSEHRLMPEREIAERGGATKVRTIKLGKEKYAHVFVVRKKGKRGGKTVLGPVRRRKR